MPRSSSICWKLPDPLPSRGLFMSRNPLNLFNKLGRIVIRCALFNCRHISFIQHSTFNKSIRPLYIVTQISQMTQIFTTIRFYVPQKKGYQKNLRHLRHLRDLNNMWFQPLDRTGRFPLTLRNPMKKIDEKKKKRVIMYL